MSKHWNEVNPQPMELEAKQVFEDEINENDLVDIIVDAWKTLEDDFKERLNKVYDNLEDDPFFQQQVWTHEKEKFYNEVFLGLPPNTRPIYHYVFKGEVISGEYDGVDNLLYAETKTLPRHLQDTRSATTIFSVEGMCSYLNRKSAEDDARREQERMRIEALHSARLLLRGETESKILKKLVEEGYYQPSQQDELRVEDVVFALSFFGADVHTIYDMEGMPLAYKADSSLAETVDKHKLLGVE